MRVPVEDSPDAGAPAVLLELMPAPEPARRDTPDLAPGPLMEEAKPTPEPAREAKVEPEKELPRVEESPLAPEPEVVLPIPRPLEEKQPEEEQPKEEVATQSETQAVAAPLTTAPPPVEGAEERPLSKPQAGMSASNARARVTWEKALVSHINRYKRYPQLARARGKQGAVSVQFTIDREGRVLGSKVVRSSGSPALDEEAIAVLQRANPLPPPPTQVAGATFDLVLPIRFHIR
jgi:protein TonB